MKTKSVPSLYRYCMSRLSTVAVSTLVPALKVLSTTLPDSTFFSLVRTKAPPLPGLTCWNSTTAHSWPSRLSTRPFLRSFVVATSLPSSAVPGTLVPGSLSGNRRHGTRQRQLPPRRRRKRGSKTGSVTDVSMDDAIWLGWARELHSIAQAGLTYADSPFDRQRYSRLREITADLTAALAEGPPDPIKLSVMGEAGYLTPKIDVRAAVHDEQGRVLMVREASDGRWTMPGG